MADQPSEQSADPHAAMFERKGDLEVYRKLEKKIRDSETHRPSNWIDLEKVHGYRQQMDKFRYRDFKHGFYSQKVQQKHFLVQSESKGKCDKECVEGCFSDSQGTALYVFDTCVI